MLYFGSMERLEAMTFDEKRELLHWLFDGIDSEGTLYGIYITTKAKGTYDYFIYGRLIEGLRTVRGSDIDYYPDEKQKAEVVEFKGEDLNYKTSNVCRGKTLTHGKPRQSMRSSGS